MNASYRWLKDFVDIDLSPTELRDLLTARCATGIETNENSEIFCAVPFSVISKSSRLRSVTGTSPLPVTTTSTVTNCVAVRNTGCCCANATAHAHKQPLATITVLVIIGEDPVPG